MTNLRSFLGKNILLTTGIGLLLLRFVVDRVAPTIPGGEAYSALLLNAGCRVLLLGICLLLLDKQLSVTTSTGLIVLVFAIDMIGVSEIASRGLNKTLLLGIGWRISILGICLLLLKKHITVKSIWQSFKSLLSLVRVRQKDIGFAVTLFSVVVIVGGLYLSKTYETFYNAPFSVTQFVWPFGILLGMVSVLAYAIFRLGMNSFLSFVCSFSFIISANHLRNLYYLPKPDFRFFVNDYSKVPFVLAFVLIIGLLIRKPLKRVRLFYLSAVCGIVLGSGFLVREDFIVFIAFVLVLFFLLPGSLMTNMKNKVTALIFFVIGFLLFFAPTRILILSTQKGSLASLNAVNGLMTSFNDRLGITRPGYDWGHIYLDEFVYAITKSQANIDIPQSEDWNLIGYNYLFKIIRNFPVDMLTRVYASVLKILDLPFIYTEPPVKTTNYLVQTFYNWRGQILNYLAGSGLFFCIVALLIISAYSLWKAIFCLCFLLFFAGYPTLQFGGRHYFHLEFITLWTLGFVIQNSISFLGQLARRWKSGEDANLFTISDIQHLWKTYGKRVMGFAVGLLLIILFPLLALRQYQSWHVGNLLNKYLQADKELLPLVQLPLDNDKVLVTSPGRFKPAPERSISAEYLVAEFSGNRCGYSTVWPVLRYASSSERVDFSRSVSINLMNADTKTTRLFFPAISYNHVINWQAYTYFHGIEMSREQVSCLRALYRIKNPNQLPILLTIITPFAEKQGTLYQKIYALETDNNIHTVPSTMTSADIKDVLHRQLSPLTAEDIDFKDDIVAKGVDKWIIKGYATFQKDPCLSPVSDRSLSTLAGTLFVDVNIAHVDTDLLITKERLLRKGTYFIAQGMMYTGGVTFGLVKDGQTAGYINVANRGPFTVIIEVPEDGMYSLGLANYLDLYTSLENNLILNKIGWVNNHNKLSRR
jgi:hypothetical protein